MIAHLRRVVVGAVLLFSAVMGHAQSKVPTETRNAALRYWLAFAELQDPPADKATADLLEKTAAGEAAWDEAKLGPILDKNESAIWRMQRATKLPECDWGLEYDLGPRASIAYVPKARVLARLNTLDGMRLAAKGDSQKAVETWLAGIRFSQHLAKGGSLIFSLVAKMGLISSFHALTQAAQNGALTDAQKKQIESVVRALPETGFDWGQAWQLEGASLENGFREIWRSPDPRKAYESFTGEPMPEGQVGPGQVILKPDGKVLQPGANLPPTKAVVFPFGPKDFQVFEDYMSQVQASLATSPEVARGRLEALETERKTVPSLLQRFIPSPLRVNTARTEIAVARQNLLHAIDAK